MLAPSGREDETCLAYARTMREFILSSTKYADELRVYKHTNTKYKPKFQMEFHFYAGDERKQGDYKRVMRVDLAQDPLILYAFTPSIVRRWSLVLVAMVQEKKKKNESNA